MRKKIYFAFMFASLVFLASEQAFAEKRIKVYPSRISTRKNYSYYKYRRRVISYPASGIPYNRSVYRRPINPYQYAVYRNPNPYAQNFAPPRQQVFEEEIREEFRTWDPPSGSPAGFGSYRIGALEREVSEIKEMIKDISQKIRAPSGRYQESREKRLEAEKIEKLKKELRELKTLLEEFRRRK